MESLPVEICQDIFLSALPYEQFLERSSPTREDAANFHIAATCVRWRNIALQTPSLWSRIKVHGLYNNDWILQYVSLHLERSGMSPLDLRFSLDKMDVALGPEPEGQAFAYERSLQLAGQHVHRWSRIHIECPYWMTSHDLGMLTKQCPLLEELVLLTVRDTTDYRSSDMLIDVDDLDNSEPSRYFRNAHNLVRLESHATPMVPMHPLERLTFLSISLRDIPDSPLWQTLAMTPNLQDLHVYYPIYGSGRSPDSPSVAINLPHLTSLAIYGLPDSFEWIDVFDAPKVTTLAVSIEPCPRLNRLFIKLRDTVRHLIITTVDPTDGGGFLNVTDAVALDHLSALDTFEIRNLTPFMLQKWNGSFFDHLVDRARERKGWVAGLQRFVINGCTFQLDACESLLAFVHAKYDMTGEERGFVCDLVGGTVLLRSADESDSILDNMPQSFRDAVVMETEFSDEWVDEDDADDDEAEAQEEADVDGENEAEGDGHQSGEVAL